MDGQPNESYYASRQLSEAQKRIERLAQSMVVQRAQVEKYRQADLNRARESYSELQKTRKNLQAALSEAQLSLLEVEEYATASAAGKLSAGLGGFDLMSGNYKPVYEAMNRFAQSLPTEGSTTNARVIGRLMNNVRMGYYVRPYGL